MPARASLKIVLAQVAPGLAVHLLGDLHRGHAASVVDLVADLGGAIGAVQIPGPDGIPASLGKIRRVGGGGRFAAIGNGVAIGAAVVSRRAARVPAAGFGVGRGAGVIVDDDLVLGS